MPEIIYDANTKMKNGFPKIKKLGAVCGNGEMTPFVWNGRLMRLELVDSTNGLDKANGQCSAAIRDVETGEFISFFAEETYFHSAYIEEDTAYVLGVDITTWDTIYVYESHDLINWESRVLINWPGWKIFNTALTKSPEGYALLLEADEPKEYVGDFPYTFFFATSPDMKEWTLLDPTRAMMFKDRYNGAPWMRYSDGYFYVITLQELPCLRYTNYLFRTKDFITWEDGLYNPLLMPSEEDRLISPNAHADLTDELKEQITGTGFLSNNSDIDMCDWNGKTYINYLAGNQLGFYYMLEAEYDGTVAEFLKRNFE